MSETTIYGLKLDLQVECPNCRISMPHTLETFPGGIRVKPMLCSCDPREISCFKKDLIDFIENTGEWGRENWD